MATVLWLIAVVLVVALLGGFFVAWKRDQSRSDAVADDPARLDTDATPTQHVVDGR